jgi:tetratricopeptide (TPR) repeat protein
MIGDHLGRWVLDRELGRGGMGKVFLAHDAGQPERLAAIKVLAGELTAHAGSVRRFEREIEVLGALDHPNIIHFYESGTHAGLLYYAMEYVEGRDFADILDEETRLPWPEVLDVAIQVCAALKHAHDHGIIHRDLKPSNLMRADGAPRPEGSPPLVKLTDFGIAHVFASKHLTRTGAVVGTAEYLSPEQAEGKPATRRSDLYSLGCVLYTLLCGRNPFRGENILDLLHKHRYAQFDPPRKLLPDLPHELDEVICDLLQKDPEKRPPDAGVLQRRLEALRRKLANRGDRTVDAIVAQPTQAYEMLLGAQEGPAKERGEGPATLMSRLVRQELESQNRGGPVRQFFNRPVVLVVLFVLCAGTLVWTFWPRDPETLYEEGRALLESPNQDDWLPGWEKLQRVQSRQPDGPHAAEIARYRQKVEAYQEARRAALRGDALSEAQWFYEQGRRRRQQGDIDGAKAIWKDLIASFRDVPAEDRWVHLAEKELAREGAAADGHRWDSVRHVLERAKRLRADGQAGEAEEVYRALEELYRDDPSAKDILDEVRRARGG